MPGTTALATEDELVDRGLEVLAAEVTAYAQGPYLELGEDAAGQGRMMSATLAPVTGDRGWRRQHRNNRTSVGSAGGACREVEDAATTSPDATG